MAAMSVEIMGKAAVAQTPEGSSSMQIVGKAAVESNDGRSLEIIGKAAVSLEVIGKAAGKDSEGNATRGHMVHFSWTSSCLTCTGVCFWCVILFVRFVYLWQQCLLRGGASPWSVVRASVVLGTEVGLFVMAVLLVLLVPRMIVTWTTALVFKYIIGVVVSGRSGRKQIVREGNQIAKDISWITLTSVFEEGNVVAAAVLVLCFTTAAVLRQLLAVG